MPGIEYTLKNHIKGSSIAQDVEVMGKDNARIRVPCVGFTNEKITQTTKGHYVKVIAERYYETHANNENDWKYISVDDAVLGWRTNQGSAAKGNWIVYLLTNAKGVPIIVPRVSNKSSQLQAAG